MLNDFLHINIEGELLIVLKMSKILRYFLKYKV